MSKVEVADMGFGALGVIANKRIDAKTVILTLKGQLCCLRTRHSIELAGGMHIEDPIGSYINHSFSPNCTVTPYGQVIASVTIFPGEELTTNYLQHEKEISCPFIDERTGIKVGQ